MLTAVLPECIGDPRWAKMPERAENFRDFQVLLPMAVWYGICDYHGSILYGRSRQGCTIEAGQTDTQAGAQQARCSCVTMPFTFVAAHKLFMCTAGGYCK